MVKMRILISLLALALFLFMASPCVGSSGREVVVVFEDGQTEVSDTGNNVAINKRKPLEFFAPAFVGGMFKDKKFLMILCDARYNGASDVSFMEPAARRSYKDYKTWSNAEIVFKNTRNNNGKQSVLGNLSAVMKGNKIYVLASSCESGSVIAENYYKCSTSWDPVMIVGTVVDRSESNGGSGVTVQWENKISLKRLLPNKVSNANVYEFIGSGGNGVVTKSGTIIFPIHIYDYYMNCISSIIYSTDNGSTWQMGGYIRGGPSKGSVTEWGNGKLLLSTRYDGGARLIYESNDMGTTWKESTVFSHVWGNQQSRSGVGSQGSVITVSVDGNDILLFSHPLNTKDVNTRDTLQLWMSDGKRILCVGKISKDGKEERSGNSILSHVGDHLYIMHEINPYESGSNRNADPIKSNGVIALSAIQDLFDSVKSTVRSWREVDEELEKKNVPTNGIVGFLADSSADTVWEDKYNCVHANVNGATRVDGGFRFDGKEGSGAQWPVYSQGQNQVYTFTQKQFTIMATVAIQSTEDSGDHLLLGASKNAEGNTLTVGLGYTQDKKWYAVDSKGVKIETKVLLTLNKEYKVAITYAHGKVSVYLDDEAIIKGREIHSLDNYFNHFFMGGIGKPSKTKGCMCTVKNVMLFNQDIIQPQENEVQNVENDGKQKDSTSSTKPQETSDGDKHGSPNEDGNDKEDKKGSTAGTNSTENPILNNRTRDGDSKKDDKRGDGAARSIYFSAWTCFVYSAIVFVGL